MPPKLNELTIISTFSLDDHFVDHLPSSLSKLTLARSFQHPYNTPLDHLPSSLTHLTLHCCLQQPLDHLPSSLKFFSNIYSDNRHQLLANHLFNHSIDHLPSSLILAIAVRSGTHFDHLPLSLTFLQIYTLENYSFLDFLPATLTQLILPPSFDMPADHLPSSFFLN